MNDMASSRKTGGLDESVTVQSLSVVRDQVNGADSELVTIRRSLAPRTNNSKFRQRGDHMLSY